MTSVKEHKIFSFNNINELKQEILELGLDIKFQDNIDILLQPYKIKNLTLRNRLLIQPMEGCDGSSVGDPEELTFRRYKRFAAGGAGLIWMEANAVVPEGRANPRQIMLTKANLSKFQKLIEEIHKSADTFDKKYKTTVVLQLTHSGRYSKPKGKPEPIIAHHSKILDPVGNIPEDYPLISDDELKRLEDKYVESAILAEKAGFDGVDIKSCHRYLLSELLASFTRENSIYGGSFENRTRLIKNIALKIKDNCKSIFVSTRINAYDAIEYPYGFGVNKEDILKPDLSEIKQIVNFFKDLGSPIINITIGNPYFNPHVNRPYDLPVIGSKLPSENPLAGVERFFKVVKDIQQNNPEISVIGGGYTYLRQFFPFAAAYNVNKGYASLIGLGRMGFAYPDFVKDLLTKKNLEPTKVCVACSACTQIMRDGGKAGCVPRDGEVYGDIYKSGRMNNPQEIIKMAEECRNCVSPTCRTLCPANVNIPAFVMKIADGDFLGAYDIITENNPFPEICGYVCPSEELCQKGCINRFYDQSVRIKHLQRFVSEKARENNHRTAEKAAPHKVNKKVAVIGAGPSGLACAKTLASFGVEATIFDKSELPGGVPFDLIPEERISDNILQSEIKYRTAGNDLIKFRGKVALSEKFNLSSIFSEGFDAIYIAAGLTENTKLPVRNYPKSGVEDAFAFLKRIKKGINLEVPAEVAIIGGGNTAIDAATTAKKAGAKDVYIIYRRTFNEIPAWPKEREYAMNIGVNFLILTQPIDYISDSLGRLKGIKVVRTKLSETTDSSGRRKPVEIPNTDHIIDCQLAIEAIGQKPDKDTIAGLDGVEINKSGLIIIKEGLNHTSRKGVFAGGDIINGGDTVVRAIGDGVRSTYEILDFLGIFSPKKNFT